MELKNLFVCILIPLMGVMTKSQAEPLQGPKERVGQLIFFDPNLSINGNQACADCHGPKVGWTGPDAALNAAGSVYEGSIPGRFGNRKPPSSAYATPSPILHFEQQDGEVLFSGGNFWDGRATGEKLGNPAADQAQGPFLNPLEQALNTPADVVGRVCKAAYGGLFRYTWGRDICHPKNVGRAYDAIALSIAAFEAAPISNAYSSKYDYYLRHQARLTQQERRGLTLFKGKAKCSNCHTADPGPKGAAPLFTDFTYDNIGVPRNPDNPFYTQKAFNPLGYAWVDRGLGDFLSTRPEYRQYAGENAGKQKVPTLRNVDKRPYAHFVKAYGHNGYFKSLKSIVHFYNTRDIKPVCKDPLTPEPEALAQDCWPAPELSENLNTGELGNLGLTEQEEEAIVAFLTTLSDGYRPRKNRFGDSMVERD